LAGHFPRMDGQGRRRGIEWPSVFLCAAVYGGFIGLTFFHNHIPTLILVVLLAPLLTLQSSMQHEFIHGHPTPWRKLNRALASVPLTLWLPFESYRMSHLVHHCDEALTDPLDDPESYYWSTESWARLGMLGRGFIRAHSTLAGRLLLGPAWNIGRFLRSEARAIAAGHPITRRIWLWHGLWAAFVLLWVVGICGIDPLFYALAIVYPSTSILMLRSFAEHRAANGVFERTAIVENAPIFGFLFLYNNLHAAHHERPLLPWYELPGWYRENRDRLGSQNGDLVYDGYAEVARRFLFIPHDVSIHPDHAMPAAPTATAPRFSVRFASGRRPAKARLAGLAAKIFRATAKNASAAGRSVS
jgi:fatty acid desaturase